MFYSILKYEIILFWLWFYEIIIIDLKDLGTSRDILNGNDCACSRFRETGLYFYLYKFFREPLWSPPPYLKIRHIRLQNQIQLVLYDFRFKKEFDEVSKVSNNDYRDTRYVFKINIICIAQCYAYIIIIYRFRHNETYFTLYWKD